MKSPRKLAFSLVLEKLVINHERYNLRHIVMSMQTLHTISPIHEILQKPRIKYLIIHELYVDLIPQIQLFVPLFCKVKRGPTLELLTTYQDTEVCHYLKRINCLGGNIDCFFFLTILFLFRSSH